MAYFGVTSEKMALVTKKHTGTVKLLTALLSWVWEYLFFSSADTPSKGYEEENVCYLAASQFRRVPIS